MLRIFGKDSGLILELLRIVYNLGYKNRFHNPQPVIW